jgi:lysozyme family protein
VRKRGAARLVTALCDRRLGFLRSLSTFSVFGRGWTSRVATIRAAALAAAGAAPTNLSQRSLLMDFFNGYKTYIVAAIMLLTGLAQLLGVDLPAVDSNSAAQMVMEALAVIFLRKGLKSDIGRA